MCHPLVISTFTMSLAKSVWALLLSAGLSVALKRSPTPPKVDGGWVVSNVPFYKSAQYTFTNGLPNGLIIANWDTGLNWRADAANTRFKDGYLELWVPGGQRPPAGGKYSGAEVDTVEGNIAYGSFRTIAILTKTPGVCNGMYLASHLLWLSSLHLLPVQTIDLDDYR